MNNHQEITRRATSKKLALSLGFIIVSIVYALWQQSGGSHSVVITTFAVSPNRASSDTVTPGESYRAANEALLKTLAQITGSTSPSLPPATAPVSPLVPQSTRQPVVTTPAPVPTPAPQKPIGLFANGSYTGNAADAYYGTVQVKAIVKNGQLADVQFLQYPNDRSNSQYINSQAMPLLIQEAIQAQSAQVDGVSGATFTSQAFEQSLATALTLAKN